MKEPAGPRHAASRRRQQPDFDTVFAHLKMWHWASIVVWLCVSVSAGAVAGEAPVDPRPPPACPTLPVDKCPGPDRSSTPCSMEGTDMVVCCHLASMFELKERVAGKNMTIIKSIQILNASFPELDASFFNFFHSLESLSITDGNISMVTQQFPAGITCLNLSGNMLNDIESNALASLTKLNNLDISRNNLTGLPTISVVNVTDFWLDISGTNELPCNIIEDLMSKMKNESCQLHFLQKNDTFCNLLVEYWFRSDEKIPLTQMEQKSKVLEDCPSGCKCKFHRLDIVEGSSAIFSVAVDCSGQQLTELPEKLPVGTAVLNVNNNNISHLKPLTLKGVETGYSMVREFYADNNCILSINDLEGSDFINRFAILSLRYNHISVIPTYFLSSSFDRNDIMIGHVLLGGNKIECNCNTIALKTWLKANHKHVQDYNQVQCKNMDLNVIELDRSQLCVYKHMWTDYIHYIIAGEVALLILLIAKVSYDYWVFKTAGYLPWPASKMPKLPCDWVFET